MSQAYISLDLSGKGSNCWIMSKTAALVNYVNKVYCWGISQSYLRQQAVNISLCSVLFLLPASRALDITRVLSIGQIKLFGIQTVYLCLTELFEIELFWHLAVCKQKTVLRLNWIVCNKTVYKNGFGIK